MKRPATEAEREHLARVRALPCIVCYLRGEAQTSPKEAHHLKRDPTTGQSLGGSQKAPHWATIPLCRDTHHWNGVNVHMGSREFERRWGNEIALLERTYEMLNLAYPYQVAS